MTGARVKDWIRRFRTEMVRPLRIRLAARARARSKGIFIGVTGSSGKSTTTASIAAIMAAKGSPSFHLERIQIDMVGKVNCWKLACRRQECCHQCGLFVFEHCTPSVQAGNAIWTARIRVRPAPKI